MDRPQRLIPWSSPKCPTEPHILHLFPGTSTPREEVFFVPEPELLWKRPRQGAHCARQHRLWEGGIRLDVEDIARECPETAQRARFHANYRRAVRLSIAAIRL